MVLPGTRRWFSLWLLACFAVLSPCSQAQEQTSVRTQSNSTGGFADLLKSPQFTDFIKSKLSQKLQAGVTQQYVPQYPPQFVPQYMPAPAPPMAPQPDANPWSNSGRTSFRAGLTRQEAARLASHDIRILVDKSGSMGDSDCPAPMGGLMSRWDWCRMQTASVTQEIAANAPQGITVVPFASRPERHVNVGADEISRIFYTEKPSGGTNLARAMDEELNDYFSAGGWGRQPKPLLLVVITDGVPDNKGHVKNIIKDTAERVRRPGEVRVVFLTVGNDQQGASFLYELDNELVAQGAAADIVATRPFGELARFGLARTLARILM